MIEPYPHPTPRALPQSVEKWGERGGWVVAFKLKLKTLAKILFKVFFIANKIQSWIGASGTSLYFSTLTQSLAILGFWRCSTLCFNKIGGVGPMCGGEGAWSPCLIFCIHTLYTMVNWWQKCFSSMSVALPKVKEMISEMSRNALKIPTWVLISFNDPDAKLVKKTSNVAELKKSLDSLDYNGGGDLPEVALKGGTFDHQVSNNKRSITYESSQC